MPSSPSIPTIGLSPAAARSLLMQQAAERQRQRSVEACRIADARAAAAVVRDLQPRRLWKWAGMSGLRRSALRRSGLLLADWYGAAHGLRSLREVHRHFAEKGIPQDLAPNPFFDATWYRAAYLASSTGEAPIDHYLRIGAINALRPGPLFDPVLYTALNPDLAQEPDLLSHFLRKGIFEGRRFLPEVSTE